MNVSNMPPDFMQQLSQFGFNLTAKDQDKRTNLELDELSTENRNILKESSMFKASTNLKDRVQSTELSFKGRSSDELTSAMMPQSSADMNSNQESKYSKLMSKLQQQSMKPLQFKDMVGQTESEANFNTGAQMSQLKQSELFSNRKRKADQEANDQRFNRWLDENDQKEDRVRSFEDVKGNFAAAKTRDENTAGVKEEDDRSPDLEKSELESNYKSMEGLMMEKQQLKQEQEKIKNNKFLKMVDRSNAIKSVRSLSRTIDELINKEKEKISDHYASKLGKSGISNLTNSKFGASKVSVNSKAQQADGTDNMKSSGLKSKSRPSPSPAAGANDSLSFSQLQ